MDEAQMQQKLKSMSPEELAEFQKQNCIFCQIISGKVPAKKVYEDDKVLAALDINPASKGHMLLMPKEHYPIMPIVPPDVLAHMFVVAKKLSKAVLKGLKATGVSIFIANGGVAGQRAQHFMIHLIPRYEADDVGLVIKDKKIKDVEEIREKIRTRIGYKQATDVKVQIFGADNKPVGLKERKPLGREIVNAEFKENVKDTKRQSSGARFVTSNAAKRYHTEKCAFAQNIREENKVYMNEAEAETSGKEPCTCVTGKKIQLKKKENKIVKKSAAKKKNNNYDSDDEMVSGVDLDSIAELLG